MTVIEIMQGFYGNITGNEKGETLAQFARDDAHFLVNNPRCAAYHHPCWREREVPDTATAPWGHEWYIIDEAGRLKLHSAQYDSSG